MIKRRKYKRKNPADSKYMELLIYTIRSGSGYDLASAITYYKQGEICDDCGENDYFCKCEYCEDCKFNRCLCDLNYNDFKWHMMSIREKSTLNNIIKYVAWELAKETLNEEQWNIFIHGEAVVEYMDNLKSHKL